MELYRANQLPDTEAERAKQKRKEEHTIPMKERISTVNQPMVQIQELQDKVNSLHDSRIL